MCWVAGEPVVVLMDPPELGIVQLMLIVLEGDSVSSSILNMVCVVAGDQVSLCY